MSNLSKIISVAALFMAGLAQTNFAQAQTNEVLSLNIDLTAVSQGPATTNHQGTITDLQCSRITSRSIIQVLGTALGDTFSRRAKLVVVTPTNSLENWTIQIDDGTNAPVDVTGFFGHQPGSVSVSGTKTDRKGNASVTDFSVDSFSLLDQTNSPALTEHFSVSGFTVLESKAVVKHHGTVVGQSVNISAQVSGAGDNKGTPTVITGSITAESGEGEDWSHEHGD